MGSEHEREEKEATIAGDDYRDYKIDMVISRWIMFFSIASHEN